MQQLHRQGISIKKRIQGFLQEAYDAKQYLHCLLFIYKLNWFNFFFFFQKQFQRDNLDKSKSKKGGVSDSAVKAYMAKKRQVEEQKRGFFSLFFF